MDSIISIKELCDTLGIEWDSSKPAAYYLDMVKENHNRTQWKLANWACADCGYVNDGDWLACHVCKKPRA